MKVINETFDPEKNEKYIKYEAIGPRVLNVWISLQDYNFISSDFLLDVAKVMHNTLIDRHDYQIGETAMQLEDKFIYVNYNVDELGEINLDRVKSMTPEGFKEFINYKEYTKIQLN